MWYRPFLWSLLQRDRENREHLKYFRNVYCVMTNYNKDQDKRTSPKTTNCNWRSCLPFSFLTPDCFFVRLFVFSRNTITFQKYFWCSRLSRFDYKLAWDQASHCGEKGKKIGFGEKEKKKRAPLASLADIFPIWSRFLPFSPMRSLVPG